MVDGKETTVDPNATASASTSLSPTPTALSGNAEPNPISGASTPSISPTSSPSQKKATGAIAGGVVGGVAGLTLIAGALWWLFRLRTVGRGGDPSALKWGYGYPLQEMDHENERRYPQELPNAEVPLEADGMQRNELDDGGKREWRHT